MKTITFDRATQEEAENKKEEWLSANKGLTVIAVRKFPLTKIPNHPYVPVEYAVSIELDYEGEMPERIHSVSPDLQARCAAGLGFRSIVDKSDPKSATSTNPGLNRTKFPPCAGDAPSSSGSRNDQ